MNDPADLPCLSLHAPWLWAIMHAGKDIENRSPVFPKRFRGKPVVGDVWLHASKWPGAFDPLRPLRGMAAVEWADEMSDVGQVLLASKRLLGSGEMAEAWSMRGHIVGRVEVVRFIPPGEDVSSPWRQPGSLAIEIRNPRLLAKPVPASGALGWWSHEATRAALREQLAARPTPP